MTDPGWGKPYGSIPFLTDEGVEVWLYRKGQRCRWYDAAGNQVGPDQRNVAPAYTYAMFHGWTDPSVPAWLSAGATAEVRRNLRVRA
jgi:hypothetical protein